MDEHDKEHRHSPSGEGMQTAPTESTTPKTPAVDPQRLSEAFSRLQVQFQLTEKQLTSLPALSDVTLVPQHDSHLIVNTTGVRPAHSFKLFVGLMEWKMEGKVRHDNAYVYLFKGRGKQMKMEICSPDAEGCWAPFEVTYFGSLKRLAYPFNEWIGAPRFIVAVKFYFMLAWKSGLFVDDPGFEVTNSWVNDLQGACDDLIEAHRREGCSGQVADRELATTSKGPGSELPVATAMDIKKRARAHPRNEQPQARQRSSSVRIAKQVTGKMESDGDDSGIEPRRGQAPHPQKNYSPYSGYLPLAPLSHYALTPDRYHPRPPHVLGPPALYGTPPPRFPAAPPPPPFYYGSPRYYPSYSDHESPVFPPLGSPRVRATNRRVVSSQREMGSTYGNHAEAARAPLRDQHNESSKSRTQRHATESLCRKTSATVLRAAQNHLPMKGGGHTCVDERVILENGGTKPETDQDRESASLEEEYINLYNLRDDTQARMNDIKNRLTDEEYRALVVKIEGLQPATLHRPIHNSGC